MILVLIAAAIVSAFIGDITDSVIILVIVLLNAAVGFIQEYRAEKAMEALKKMAALQTVVKRGDQIMTIDASLLVPGDLILLEAGMMVPADLRITETHALEIDEAALTGESIPVTKTSKTVKEVDAAIGDRLNMAYKGTIVTKGKGTGVAVETGMNTEIGHIARLLQEKENVTPLQKRMNDFGKKLSYIILSICLVLFVVGLLRGEPTMQMMLVAISLAVAAIPEALPALITVALATGAKRLAKRNALIRKLPAVETLGSVTFICTDKTGTLTQNKMTVVRIEPQPIPFQLDARLSVLECFMILDHDLKKTQENKWIGDPTELALVEYVQQQHSEESVTEIPNKYPSLAVLPFDSDRKCMTTVHLFQSNSIVKRTAGSLVPFK